MEIGTYVRGLGWRAVLSGALIVAAVGAPVAFTLRRPVQYVAVAAVRAPALAPGSGTPEGEGESSQLAADLGAILGLSATRTALAAETGVSAAALKEGLTVARAGSAEYVDVTFRDPSRARARRVARAAALRALTILTEERLVAPRFTLEAAEQRLQAVNLLDSAERPLVVYRRARSDEARLERLVISRLALGDPIGAESARTSLGVARGATAEAAAQLIPFERATANGEGAQAAVDEARKQFLRLEERSKAVLATRAVTNGPVRREVPVKELASVAIGGGLAAGTLSFGLITLAEVRSVLRRRSRPDR